MACQKTCELQRREVKWVALVAQGEPASGSTQVGSVGALGSVNTVVAALLGRVVLGEPLGKLHILAMIFSLSGAVLISDPAQAIATMGSSIFGNLLALLAGISLGFMFISSRFQRWIVCWSLAFIPAVPDGHFLLLRPGERLRGHKAIFFTNIFASVASKKCPAALSSTVMTGSSMAFGPPGGGGCPWCPWCPFKGPLKGRYVMDILMFHRIPKTTGTEAVQPDVPKDATPSSVAGASSAPPCPRCSVQVPDRSIFVPRCPCDRETEGSPAAGGAAVQPAVPVLGGGFAPAAAAGPEPRGHAELRAAGATGSVSMVADRPIAAGEELSFVYISAPDAVLLVQYAMAPAEGNVHNMAGRHSHLLAFHL
eukprot:Skav211887  [mRNA]  locus=scaffold2402:31384:42561:- [translate_table: standard]